MIVFGLTGGVGVGKSAIASLIGERGTPVIDTDIIAREVVAPGEEGFRRVVELFGQEIIDASGFLNRGALAAVVFSNLEKRRELEAILHPLIREEWERRVRELRESGAHSAVVVIPLLFETGAEAGLDRVICVGCTERTQKERLRQRGWSDSEISNRIGAQMPLREKMERADYVIWNESSLEVCSLQLNKIAALQKN
jgi:dephospho-CoA kinase